jgi:hypothetical protein
MKRPGHLLLLCALLSSQVWGQSVPKHPRSVVVRCVSLTCSSFSVVRTSKNDVKLGTFYSFPRVSFTRRGQTEVRLGTFKSFEATASRRILRQVSQVGKGAAEIGVGAL